MPRSVPARTRYLARWIGLWGLAAGIVCSAGVLPACKGGGRRPVKSSSGVYDGPPVTLDSSGSQHVVVLQAPSAGWTFSLDRAERKLRGTELFLTATGPDPAFMHAQHVVSLRAGTGVESDRPVVVYVRVTEHGTRPRSEYVRADRTQQSP